MRAIRQGAMNPRCTLREFVEDLEMRAPRVQERSRVHQAAFVTSVTFNLA